MIATKRWLETDEVRKLTPSVVQDLARFLDTGNSWKILMEKIPKQLGCADPENEFRCDITSTNPAKYNFEHIRIIEQYAEKKGKSCTEILFSEWGTSGRPRANLGHLFYLLISAGLFGAADKVADLLGKPHPPRPLVGPAAVIKTDLIATSASIGMPSNNDVFGQPMGESQLPVVLMSMDEQRTSSKVVSSQETSRESVGFMSSSDEDLGLPSSDMNISANSVISTFFPRENNIVEENSNMQIPQLNFDSESTTDNNEGVTTTSSNNYSMSDFGDLIPQISQLLSLNDNEKIVPSSENSSTDSNLPMTISESHNKSTVDIVHQNHLPNISLKTMLPHVPYADLKKATKNFSRDESERRLLGEGGSGSVFLATNLIGQQYVAVKKIYMDDTRSANLARITKQFRQEVEDLCIITHPNIISLLGYSCDGDAYCLIYEYVPGGSLADVLKDRSKSLSWKQRLYVALGTAKAVAYLHAATPPIIHRDIKPSNILLDETNNSKLCDFGIAKIVSEIHGLSTERAGTNSYMAPELFELDVIVTDRSDTWSFGVVLIELLTSLPPTDPNRDDADIVSHFLNNCEHSIEPLLDKTIGTWKESGFDYADLLRRVVLRCLDDNAEKRPSMASVATLLEQMNAKLVK